ncbi:MAG: hypothetical protein HC887_11680 [Desulfobacteraceae bacterium]|nr:hypothetical protein [Desulfobacteraceae bacterium]
MIIQNTSENIAHKLEQLAEIYRQGQASEIMLKTLHKLFGYETETCKSQIRQLQSDLSDFEKQYGMSSDIFWQNFQQGKTDDRMDFVEWASLVQMVERLEKRLFLLTSERNI